ncbi:UDP-N-acetylmuramoyl-L-alanyl-D-glutamate--2,6-diaminopimelate ligase [Halomonas sp. NO4]|uniref:UDP-N-acetylmuramoyl-L-alanyl-D-glutamate--2, 6-diaminopimelate ligase n=1 Tax=Halomonas sp. NO4 TaxID=2484813 RepID=UPI0013D86097|nr:UDP-N-acetylmuramoyl-L-alanyl-D-glutamate--2,6-diaminopimelate ligase [Halomonas sp. NO4]
MYVTATRFEAALRRCWPELTLAPPTSARLRLVEDSRGVAPGDVFVALPGEAADGRDHVEAALAAGASAVLYHLGRDERLPEALNDPRVLALPYLRQRLGELGQAFFAVPEALELIGVTGTNGKSSVTHYLAELSRLLGRDAGVVGTLGHGRPGHLTEGRLTTPGPLALQAALGELAGEGMTRIALEVSSHALEQGRLDGCRVSAAVFTNLSRDHLDYHGSMAAYAAAKARLFRRPELDLAVVNADDPLARLMLAGVGEGVRVLAVGSDPAATLRVLDWQASPTGQLALVATPEGERPLELSLLGRFSLDNLLLAMATLYGAGESLDDLFDAAARVSPVAGRLQPLIRPGCPRVIVDYAHTPDALENALAALRAHLPGQGRLWCLFGCGGDRDSGKRALMGAAAERQTERLVITDDNPRSEEAAAIREQVMEGLSAAGREKAWNLAGRGEAIARVLAEAAPEDVVLVAGKGHETYQEIDGVRHPFSDVDAVNRALARREASA